ncbi:hypothetical protein VB712_05845 [Spirulina sp. CCNP1310]|uniref:hypothetical protein n=1 Tax=Spirulina sp. CCNP1310 TaxID=3110249 RepID=UPI002B20D7F5|nr:hypothetical protein [Spirulina sp. CCNP1310]MEA5418741.1 hypothetical protein [Spirulina sp. CCNP1310]
MTHITITQKRQHLEKIYTKSSHVGYFLGHIRQGFSHIAHSLVHFLTEANEPRIWINTDAQGHMIYRGYDPRTGRRFEGDSEQSIRIWLEERY